MEDLERLVAGRLHALDPADPSDELRERILGRVNRQVAVRRRRRRILGSAAGAGLVAAVAALVPLLAGSGDAGTPSRLLAESRSARPEAPGRPGYHESQGSVAATAPRPASAGGIARDLPSGRVLTAFGVTSDGAVLGTGVDRRGRDDGTLWRAGLSGLLTVPVPVARAKGLYAASGGARLTIWAEKRHGVYELMCQGQDGRSVQLGSGGVARRAGAGFHADRDVAVWSDEDGGTVWQARGCHDEPKPLTKGYAAGFAYPYAYVLTLGADGRPTGELQRVQIETGAHETRVLPSKHLAADVRYAAGADSFSVSDGEELTVYDTDTWQPHVVSQTLPQGDAASLTAGDGLVVYSVRTNGTGSSLIYQTASAQTRLQEGEAYAKGPWLLTRDAKAYRLTRLS